MACALLHTLPFFLEGTKECMRIMQCVSLTFAVNLFQLGIHTQFLWRNQHFEQTSQRLSKNDRLKIEV